MVKVKEDIHLHLVQLVQVVEQAQWEELVNQELELILVVKVMVVVDKQVEVLDQVVNQGQLVEIEEWELVVNTNDKY
jgi:hypothetical protein